MATNNAITSIETDWVICINELRHSPIVLYLLNKDYETDRPSGTYVSWKQTVQLRSLGFKLGICLHSYYKIKLNK